MGTEGRRDHEAHSLQSPGDDTDDKSRRAWLGNRPETMGPSRQSGGVDRQSEAPGATGRCKATSPGRPLSFLEELARLSLLLFIAGRILITVLSAWSEHDCRVYTTRGWPGNRPLPGFFEIARLRDADSKTAVALTQNMAYCTSWRGGTLATGHLGSWNPSGRMRLIGSQVPVEPDLGRTAGERAPVTFERRVPNAGRGEQKACRNRYQGARRAGPYGSGAR